MKPGAAGTAGRSGGDRGAGFLDQFHQSGRGWRFQAFSLHLPDRVDELADTVAAIGTLAAGTEDGCGRDFLIGPVLENTPDGALYVFGTDNVAVADNHLK